MLNFKVRFYGVFFTNFYVHIFIKKRSFPIIRVCPSVTVSSFRQFRHVRIDFKFCMMIPITVRYNLGSNCILVRFEKQFLYEINIFFMCFLKY